MPTLFPEAMIVAGADRAACRDLLRHGSRSFFAASHLLPRSVREPATALYAFCRLADDAVDLASGPTAADRTAAVARLREHLDRVYRGQPLPLPADRAFADTVERYAIPRAFPDALLEGLEWDATGRRYDTLSDLRAYAARVAGAVGAMMAVVMGVRDPDVVARACDLGAAMQLTNIARDVGEDARAGRLYLPLTWLREAGLDPDAWLAAPRFTPAIGAIVTRLLDEADRLYTASEPGIAALPFACRPGIHAARLIYAAIGEAIEAQGHDTVTARAIVPSRRKAQLALRAMLPLGASAPDARAAPPLAEARFLVDVAAPASPTVRPRRLEDRMIWVLDLLHRLELQRQAAGGSA